MDIAIRFWPSTRLYTDSASPHEVVLIQAALNEIVTEGRSRRIIGDRAYDNDPLKNACRPWGYDDCATAAESEAQNNAGWRPLRRYHAAEKLNVSSFGSMRLSGQWRVETDSVSTIPLLFISLCS